MSRIVIQNGRVIDPANQVDEIRDVVLDKGKRTGSTEATSVA